MGFGIKANPNTWNPTNLSSTTTGVKAGGTTGAGTTASGTGATSGAGINWSEVGQGATMGLAIGQAIGAVASAYIGARALSKVQKSQERIMRNNQASQQIGVEMAYRQGEAIISRVTRKAGQVKGKQRTGAAANGVAIGVGNSAEYMATTDIQKEEDMQNARLNAIANAWGYQNAAGQYGAQAASLSAVSGYNSGSGAYGKSMDSAIEGASNVAKTWYTIKGGW